MNAFYYSLTQSIPLPSRIDLVEMRQGWQRLAILHGVDFWLAFLNSFKPIAEYYD